MKAGHQALFASILMGSTLMSCGGSSGSEKGDSPPQLGVSIDAALEKDCPNGGIVINQGIDSNQNGRIDQDEVTSSETVCHGSDGTDGADGTNGTDGADGSSCSVTDNGDGTKTISCTDGTTATVADGTDGADGTNGTDGADGSSCSVTDNGDGTKTISCTDGTTATVADGVDSLEELYQVGTAIRTVFGPSVVSIQCYLGGVLQGHGTGTKTTSGTIITAHHVVDSCDAAYYYHNNTLVGSGGLWTQYGSIDAVEIGSINWTAYGSSLAGVTPTFNMVPTAVGMTVYCLSYPADVVRDVQLSIGQVVDDNVTDSLSSPYDTYWYNAFTADYVATGGSSGAPVFSRDGTWMFIHVGGYSANLDLDYVLPLRQ